MATSRLGIWQEWFSAIGTRPEDTPDERAQKTALLMTSSMITFAAIVWPILYLVQGRYISASIPAGYAVISIASIVIYSITRRYAWFRFSQLLLILLLPFILQVSLGGYATGSTVMMWAFLSTVGAAIFHSRFAVAWFAAYELAIVLTAVFDTQIQSVAAPMSATMTTVMWIGNIGGVSAVVFMVTRYAFLRNQTILAEVQSQRAETERAMATVAEQSEQLKEADKTKTLFFANVSHELRTPLTLLLGPLEATLQSQALPDVEQRRLSLAARNGRRLLRQINLLLDFTKAGSGKLELELSPENPGEVVANLVEEVRPAAAARKLEIAYDGPASLPPLEIDRDRLEQALLNLLGNAIKFTPEGGTIKVGVQATAESLVISIADSGIGIAVEEIPNLFDSFHQAKRSSGTSAAAMYRQEHQGTGLGLAMAKQMVELHHGRIDVTSALGKGTTFWIHLPLVQTASGAAVATTNVVRPGGRVHTALADLELERQDPAKSSAGVPDAQAQILVDDVRPRILLVDDHADVRTYLRDLLRNSYRLLDAADGQEGIDVATRELPDLVISDVMMPKKSGFELVHELKTNYRTRGIPIMLLTARGGADGTVEGLTLGADEYLAKPFDPKELAARVMSLLRLTTIERELAKVVALQKDELEAARVIQESLLPTTMPAIPRLDVAGRILTASELGGDFYDFLPLERTNGVAKKLGVAIGDVTGHGASSALVTAVAKAGLDIHANGGSHPGEVISNLGRVVFDSCKGKRLMTFFYGVVDLKASQIHYCNAGHTFPWVVNSETGKVLPLTSAGGPIGAPLGLDRLSSYRAHTAPLGAGDVLVLFSDGLLEAESKSGQPYGPRRLRQTLEKHRRLPARTLVDTLIDSVMAYSERSSPEDDITAVIVRVEPEAAAP